MNDDHDFDDDHECWNCSGEGAVYGCSWDWQCETYDAGEGSCLCERRCDVCQPVKRNPKLDAVLSEALAKLPQETPHDTP